MILVKFGQGSEGLFLLSRLHPRHMEVPRGWIRAAAAGLCHTQPQQHQIQAVSSTYTTAHGNTGSCTHWLRPGTKPATSWFLVRFVNHWAMTGTPTFLKFQPCAKPQAKSFMYLIFAILITPLSLFYTWRNQRPPKFKPLVWHCMIVKIGWPHGIQQFHFWAYNQENWKQGLWEINAHPWSQQHYLQLPKGGSNPSVHQQMDE